VIRSFRISSKLRCPAFLAWIIDGCTAWQNQGLSPPQIVTEGTDAYLEAEDGVSAWIEERCRRDPGSFATSAALFTSWSEWAAKHGEYVGTVRKLVSTLESKGFQPMRKNSARGFQGLRISMAQEWE
jgi:putative DNA primase/helicase